MEVVLPLIVSWVEISVDSLSRNQPFSLEKGLGSHFSRKKSLGFQADATALSQHSKTV